MPLLAKSNGGGSDFDLVPQGTHKARCVQVVDLGTGPNTHHQAKPGSTKHTVMVGWELPEVMGEYQGEPSPRMIWNFYTLSLSPKAGLYKDLVSWRGKEFSSEELESGFDVFSILDVCCLLSVIHKPNKQGEIRARISGIIGVPAGTPMPPRFGKLLRFDISAWDQDAFDLLGDGLKKQIMDSREVKEGQQPHPPEDVQQHPEDGPVTQAEQIASGQQPVPFSEDDEVPF